MEGRDEGAFEDGGRRVEGGKDGGREEGDGECVEDDREREREDRKTKETLGLLCVCLNWCMG